MYVKKHVFIVNSCMLISKLGMCTGCQIFGPFIHFCYQNEWIDLVVQKITSIYLYDLHETGIARNLVSLTSSAKFERETNACFFPMSQLVCQYRIMCLGSIHASQKDDKKTYVHFLLGFLGYRNATSICLSGCQLPHHYLGPPSVTDRP